MKKFIKIIKDFLFLLALFFISLKITGDYDYTIGILVGISMAFLFFYLWKKINSKFFS